MNEQTRLKLARSLTAEDPALLPFLPYLLQDLWELGCPAEEIIRLFLKHIPEPKGMRILDLACGKGAVGISLAKRFEITIKMVDIIPEFIRHAELKAEECKVVFRCEFAVEDINDTVLRENGWDCVLLVSVGDILGDPFSTCHKLRNTVRDGGYIIIEDAFLNSEQEILCPHGYARESDWRKAFADAGLCLVGQTAGEFSESETIRNEWNNHAIARRAEELSIRFPKSRQLFRNYIQSQLNECHDLAYSLGSAIWLLWKKPRCI